MIMYYRDTKDVRIGRTNRTLSFHVFNDLECFSDHYNPKVRDPTGFSPPVSGLKLLFRLVRPLQPQAWLLRTCSASCDVMRVAVNVGRTPSSVSQSNSTAKRTSQK